MFTSIPDDQLKVILGFGSPAYISLTRAEDFVKLLLTERYLKVSLDNGVVYQVIKPFGFAIHEEQEAKQATVVHNYLLDDVLATDFMKQFEAELMHYGYQPSSISQLINAEDFFNDFD